MKKLILWFLLTLSFWAHADTVPKLTTGTTYRIYIPNGTQISTFCGGYQWYSSTSQSAPGTWLANLCNAKVPPASGARCLAPYNYGASVEYRYYGTDFSGNLVCNAGTATASTGVQSQVLSNTSCPANSTYNGTDCTCASGYIAQNGQCVQPPADPCEPTQGLTTGYTRLEVQFSNVNPSPSALGSFVGQTVKTAVPINGNSCAATGQVESCALAGTTLYCILTGSTYTGATYNGEQSLFGLPQIDPNATPENQLPKVCPEGQYAGEVNGTQVCVKANGSANTTQSTTTNPDGTSTTTTTTTACVGDKCTSTTTTETKDAQGNTTGTGTSKVEGDKDAFCMAHPQAPECKNTKSNFGGTCDAAFTCESEDAVMCAIALDQYKTNCELLKRDENLGQNLADLIDMPLTDLDLDTTSIQAPQASGSSCSITPFSIPVGIGAFTVDLTHMCAYLSIIKAIVVAFGFVFWTMIVFVR